MFLLQSSSFLALTALLLPYALAQVPASLSKGFDTEMQVNFQGDSALGFKDGDTIPFPDTANKPVFALGDSSGVNTAISFMVMMLDTTDENNFIMHYLQADLKATGDKTGLSASGEPKIPYAKPGSFGESGERQYTFLLFQQKRNSEMKAMPNAGEKFDYEAFSQANNLKPPSAGVAMKVNVGDVSAQDASSSSGSPGAKSGDGATPPTSTTETMTMASVSEAPSGSPGAKSGDGATPPTSTNQTMTMASVSEAPSSSGVSTNGTGAGAEILMIEKPTGEPVGGGIVSEQPFPSGADAAMSPKNPTMLTGRDETVGDAVNSAVSAVADKLGSDSGAVVMKAGASMAALAVMVGAVALV
jgi:Phosphatidylethanolamine-binding protein